MTKTPDDIKKGLVSCISVGKCWTECPYFTGEALPFTCIRALSADGLALIQQLEAQVPRWISVAERLPEAHADGSVDAVLVTDGEFTHMAYYAQGQWVFCESGEMKEPMWNTVTHWMPIPPVPKEEESC